MITFSGIDFARLIIGVASVSICTAIMVRDCQDLSAAGLLMEDV